MADIKVEKEKKVDKSGYNPKDEEKKVWDEFCRRKEELMDSRKNVGGDNIDEEMREWDKKYFDRDADIPASELDPDQKPIAINNAFGKVQSALSILIEHNPDLILEENKQKYSANRELIKSLAKESWRNTDSLQQLQLSAFNMAKRGWFAGRTFHRQLIHDAKFPDEVNDSGRIKYEEQLIKKMDDVAYMNLDNHNVWFDEEARPYDMYSMRDAMHREVWHIDKVKETFPEDEFPNMKYVQEGGNVQRTPEGDVYGEGSTHSEAREQKKGMTELYFYEHQFKDWFIVEINGVMVVWEPLPQNHKRLSYVTGFWNLRSAETIYGIGLVEMMERDEKFLDRIINMSLRQLILSINPPGFYSGTEDFENENIRLKAGVLRRTMNPDDISFVDIPPMKKEAIDMVDWMEQKEEQRTGVTKSLEGEPSENESGTAFELGINREASLKRLRLPLRSLQAALDWEFSNRVDLIKQVYSEYDVEHIADEEKIFDYLEEIGEDPDFYHIENEGVPNEEKFFAIKYREVPLNIEQDDSGNFVESEKREFFNIKPQYLQWDGDVRVDIDSILVQSEELQRENTLRFTNLLIPMFELPIEVGLKPAKQLTLAFDKDPKKWLPEDWLQAMEEGAASINRQPGSPRRGLTPGGQRGGTRGTEGGAQRSSPGAGTMIPQRDVEGSPSLGDRFKAAFQGFRQG